MSTPPKKPPMRGASAGMMIVGALVAGIAVGAGVGTLVGAIGPFLVLGVFVGFGGGIAGVYARFRDL